MVKFSLPFGEVRRGAHAGNAALWTASACWLAVLMWLHVRLRDMAFDDAYIHLRIARNLMLDGRAFFNPGERVMATSSPLWTILLAVFRVPAHAGVLPVIEAVLPWVCGVLAFLICRETLAGKAEGVRSWSLPVALLGALLTTVTVLTSSLGLMETPLAIALLLGAWACALRGAWATLPLLALAGCTRLELLPLCFIACVIWVWKKKSASSAAVAASLVIAAVIWTRIQFGVLLPNSMHAKKLVYAFTVRQAAEQFVALRLSGELPALALLLFMAIFGWTWWRTRGRDGSPPNSGAALRGALPLAALLWGMFVVMQYIANRTVLFAWYRPLFTVPLVLGLVLYSQDAMWRLRPVRVAVRCLQVVALLYLTLTPLLMAERTVAAAVLQTPLAKSNVDGGDSARVQGYLQLGSVMHDTCPQGRLMTAEIGALGWSLNGYVYDGFGIASPAALRFQPLTSGAGVGGIPAGYVASTLPDMIVSYTVLDSEVHKSPLLTGQYELLQLPPSPRSNRGGALDDGWHSSRNLDVWLRKDGACDVAKVEDALRRQLE